MIGRKIKDKTYMLNGGIICMAVLALLFCFIHVYDNRDNARLEYNLPDFSGSDVVWYYNIGTTNEGDYYTCDYPYWTIKQLGIRF